MKQKRLLFLLALLMTAATGAWAQSTTHVVKQENVNTIFSGEGYTLGDAVKAGDVLDFQGTIELEGDASHSLVINKQVNIISSTKDAVVKLHTVAGSLIGADPGSSFVINKAGSGTTVQDIRIENTETWIFNTSNVTFTGVTMWVEEARVGSGVGHVSIRYSDHVTFDGCTVYTKNNGGSSCCVLTYSGNCTFKDTRIESEGNTGNPLYFGNPYNISDMPSGFTGACNDCVVTGCTITAGTNSALCRLNVAGLRHRFENCTVDIGTSLSSSNVYVMTNGKSSSISAASADDGYIIRNNTFNAGLTVPTFSTAEGNTVSGGTFTVSKGATVTGNTISGNVSINQNRDDYIGSTITGNSILGKVTFSSNSKNNTFTGNTVISSDAYAVVMASTTDANNTVTDNILLAASNAGDAAVNLNNGTGNTISNNLSEAAAGDVTWNFDATTGTLTIGGTGAMADYEQTSDGHTTAPWAFISDKITRVIIGDGVTKVGSNAFQGCTALNDVFVKGAKTLTIGTAAFDATKTPAIYVPTGQEAAYQTAWSAYAGSIGEYMNCGADAMALYDAATKTLTICGKGAMTDFASAADQPWKSLQGQLQTVCFEPFITAIGANAFSGCKALTTANIEGTATTIADGAFYGNATGRRIFVPAQAIAGYGESAYAADIYATGQCGAEGSDVSWELSAQTMALAISGTGAMADYANANSVPWSSVRAKITSATIAEGVTSVGGYAFYNCSSMTAINLPEGLTAIDAMAFCGCEKLESITLPAGLTSIGSNAFSGCSNLANVTIPASVTSIGASAFRDCSKLESITLPAGLTSIGASAFYACTALTAITIPDGVTTISDNAFSGCSNLASVNIPDGVTTIDENAFYGCGNLANVNIPATVTSIGFGAFRNCTMLESITLPVSVTSVGNYAFRYCSKLAEINIFAVSLQTYGYNAFQNTPDGLKIYVPAASVETYKTGWSAYAEKIQALPFYAVTFAEDTAEPTLWTASPAANVKKGQTVTVTYTGTKKVIGVKAEKKSAAAAARPLAEAVAADLGKIAGADGNIYDTKAAAEAANTTAVAMIAYVGNGTDNATYTHGLAIALADEESQMNWNPAKSTCEGKSAVTNAAWQLPSQNQWKAMFKAFGDNDASYSGLNTAITNAGGTALLGGNYYWSSTPDGGHVFCVSIDNGDDIWQYGYVDEDSYDVRACLAF